MPHIQGKKISGRHTTAIGAAVSIVNALNRLSVVEKIVLGLIKPIRGRAVQQRLKVTRIDAGLRLKIRGATSVQELFVYTSNPRTTEEVIRKAFEN